MSPKSLVALIVLGLALLIGSQTVYVVKETDVAIKFKFGEIVQTDIEPGVHFKVPSIEVVKRFDGRVITLDTKSTRFLTSAKKYAIVDAYAQWSIRDVAAFYKATSVDIKLKYGEIVETDIEPGVRFKVPFIEVVKRFDGRVITLDTKSSRFLSSGKKYAIVDA